MKKLILFILPFSLFAEEYKTTEQELHEVIKLFESIKLPDNNIAWEQGHEQYTQSANLIRSKFLIPYLEYQHQTLKNKKMLLELEFKRKKKEMENLEKMRKIEDEFLEREMRIAEAYHSSNTCRLDGRSWYDLDPAERKRHRDNYIKFYSRPKK